MFSAYKTIFQEAYQAYHYAPLETPRDIRLLQLHRDFDGGINFNFLHVPVDNPSRYTAISYAWGDPTVVSTLRHSSGQKFGITYSAATLVRRFCYRQYIWIDAALVQRFCGDVDHQYIWIDAICINQADLEEKGR